MKTSSATSASIKVVLFTVFLFSSSIAHSQYFEWAFNPYVAYRGIGGKLTGTDMHGNGYFTGSSGFHPHAYKESFAKCYNQKGLLVWSATFEAGGGVLPPPVVYDADADGQHKRYVLLYHNVSAFGPLTLGNIVVNDPYFIVKYNGSTPVRITPLPEKFDQIRTDSLGNLFISNGLKVRRYNRNGVFQWEYVSAFEHQLALDLNKCTYLLGDQEVISLNVNGAVRYTMSIDGHKTIDPQGRLYVSTVSGLRKFGRSGSLIWNRPNISGQPFVTFDGEVFISANGTLSRYNAQANQLIWQVADLDYHKVMAWNGNFFTGGNYNCFNDIVEVCPFSIYSASSFSQISSSQTWVGLFNTISPVPFQAGIYTDEITNVSNPWSVPAFFCGGAAVKVSYNYCTSPGFSLPANTVFSVELSDQNGSFDNALNIGPPNNAIIPDSLPNGTGYRFRVVASLSGVVSYPNTTGTGFSGSDIQIKQNQATISTAGTQSICQGQTVNLTVQMSDPNAMIQWYDETNIIASGNGLNAQTVNSTGTYFARVINYNYVCPVLETDTLQLTVNPKPNPVVTPNGTLTMCQGDSIVLTVSDVDLSVVRWRESGVAVPGAVHPEFTVTAPGNYTARIINSYGCAKASPVVAVQVTCRSLGDIPSSEIRIKAYPNPAITGELVSISGLPDGDYHFNLMDVAGKSIYSVRQTVMQDEQVDMPLNGVTPGLYVMNVTGAKLNFSEKLVVIQ